MLTPDSSTTAEEFDDNTQEYNIQQFLYHYLLDEFRYSGSQLKANMTSLEDLDFSTGSENNIWHFLCEFASLSLNHFTTDQHSYQIQSISNYRVEPYTS